MKFLDLFKVKKPRAMTDEQIKALYVRVLEIAAFERGFRRQAQDMARYLKAEMIARGI